ncbi:MAG: DUF4397 domain-containing protein [Thermomicrobiales bacterium]
MIEKPGAAVAGFRFSEVLTDRSAADRAGTGSEVVRLLRARSVLGPLIIVTILAFGMSPALAQQADTERDARVRIIHGISDAGPLDVYIDNRLALFGMAFPDVGAELSLAPGDHQLAIVPSGADLESAIAAGGFTLKAAATYEIVVIGTTDSASVGLFEVSPTPLEAGRARFRVIAGIADAGDLVPAFTAGDAISPALGFGDATEYAAIDPGAYDLSILDNASGTSVLDLPQTEILEGAVTDIILVGALGDGSAQGVLVSTSVTVTRPVGNSALIMPGECARLATPGIDLGVVRPGQGDPVGIPDTLPAAQGYFVAPADFATLSGEPHAIVVTDDDAASDVTACGNIGGRLTDTGALVVAISPRVPGAPFGIAVLAPSLDDPTTTGVSIFLVTANGSAPAEASPAAGA